MKKGKPKWKVECQNCKYEDTAPKRPEADSKMNKHFNDTKHVLVIKLIAE